MKQKPNIAEAPIEKRLENWGLCQRGKGGGAMAARETRRASPYGGQGYGSCMTAVACSAMRAAAKGPAGGAHTQSKLDFDDAGAINSAWQQLGPRHRLLLRDYYALGHAVNSICRALSIRHWPGLHWNRELAAAQAAIEDIVGGGNR